MRRVFWSLGDLIIGYEPLVGGTAFLLVHPNQGSERFRFFLGLLLEWLFWQSERQLDSQH